MIEKQIAIVQHYINCRTGKQVKISITNNKDIFLLNRAYNIALRWFGDNNYDIEIIN